MGETTNKNPRETGKLIAIEGIYGAGVRTQSRWLVEYLRDRGLPARESASFSEPSAGPIGILIRQIHTGRRADQVSPSTLSLLNAADRLDRLQREIYPRIDVGTFVVVPRYRMHLARRDPDVDHEWSLALTARERQPDLTIFLAVRPQIAMARRCVEESTLAHEISDGYPMALSELRDRGEQVTSVKGENDLRSVALAIAQEVRHLVD